MSITTYAELQTFIQTAVDRQDADLPVSAADLITLAESRLNRILPLRVNWVNVALTGTPGDDLIALPTDFVEPQTLWLLTYGVATTLTPLAAGTFDPGVTPGTPQAWCVDGTDILLDVPCDQAHLFAFRYRKKLDIATDTTNWLLTNHPDVYVFATLVELWTFVQQPDFASAMHQRLDLAIAELAHKESRSISIAPLQVPADLMGPGTFNINTG